MQIIDVIHLKMSVKNINNQIDLLDASPQIQGWQKFISVYVIRDQNVSLIDTGPQTSLNNVLSGLKRLKIGLSEVKYVFLTHIHVDHGGGVGDLIEYLPNATVIVHERGAPHLENPSRLWESTKSVLGDLANKYGKMKPVPKDRIIIGYDNQEISLGEMKLRIINSPGHASHHSCFIEEKSRSLFVGEAAGTYLSEVDLIRPATPFPFNLNYSLETLDNLIQFNPLFLCYGHFGFGTKAVDRLRQYRQQLVLWAKTISAKRVLPYEGILEALFKQDKNLSGIEKLNTSMNRREKYFLLNSIDGFVKYFEKYGDYPS